MQFHTLFLFVVLSLSFHSGAFAEVNSTPAAPIVGTDQGDLGLVMSFIGDGNFSSNIYELTAHAGLSGKPKVQPWSGTFWPLRAGSTGNPYSVNTGNGLFNWISFKLHQVWGPNAALRRFHRRMENILDRMAEGRLKDNIIRDMSPSEKYDLYLGDKSFSFTNAEWTAMDEQHQYIGDIAYWEGSCHGWATAAIYEPRPEHMITVPSLDGNYMIPFYPHDLKALATRLWADSLVQNQVVREGSRCTTKDPNVDPRLGKILDETCQGVNPADFHITVLEMVGNRKQSLVVNRSNTTQVWNQPIASYELNYFNPSTGYFTDLEKAIAPTAIYQDPYAKFRAPGTTAVVGVEMRLSYIAETTPNHQQYDDESYDKIKTLTLRYDLALDSNNQILGGEWRSSTDPDAVQTEDGYSDESAAIPKFPGFLWKFNTPEPMAYSIKDAELPAGDLSTIDRRTLVAASHAAAYFRLDWYNYDAKGNITTVKRRELRPQPLSKVVNALIDQARK